MLGADVFFALSDLPWSFTIQSTAGEQVTVYVDEGPDTVTVTVQVADADGRVLAHVRREDGRRLLVSGAAPEVVVEHAHGGRTEIALVPSLCIVERWAAG